MNAGSQENSNGPDPREQERQWLRFAERIRGGEAIPFADQWAAFRDRYTNRAAAAGPPPAWIPTTEQIDQSNLGRLIGELARRLELGQARLVVTQEAYLRGGKEVGSTTG